MKDETTKEILAFLLESAKSGSEFIRGEAPLYAQEYLRYHMFNSIIGLLFACLIMAGGCVAYRSFKKAAVGSFLRDFALPLVIMLSILIGPAWAACSISSIGKNIIAPRVVIMDHITKTLKE
jgi:hypothetical protein